jgi:very-short-patch-repair endonuclease
MMHSRPRTNATTWQPPQAHSQFGVFTHQQACQAGLGRKTAWLRRRSGIWQTVAGRGLMLGSSQPNSLQKAMAGQLTWPDACLWGPTAAALYHALGWHHAPPVPEDEVVHLAVPGDRAAQLGLRAHRQTVLVEDQIYINGLRMQRLEQAVFDTLLVVPPSVANSIIAWLIARQQLTPKRFDQALAARQRRHGVGQLALLQPMVHSSAASAAELLAHQLLRQAGLRGWRPNQPIRLGSGRLVSVDILFKEARLVVEIDGRTFHSRNAAFNADRQRDAELQLAGYRVLRFTWDDLTGEPTKVVTMLQTALATPGSTRGLFQ